MNKITTTALAALTLGAMGASASMVLPQTESLSGTTYAVDDPSAASFINTSIRWTANSTGTGTTAAAVDSTSSDFYWFLSGGDLQSGGSAIPTTANYVQLDFTLTGGWVAGSKSDQIFRKTELTGGSGSSTPTDLTNLPWSTTAGAAIADGSYSVIFDLNPAPDAGTTWDYLRYDFFNESDASIPNAGGKTFTLDGVTYATNVVPEPATLGMVAIFGGGIMFIRRRFMI